MPERRGGEILRSRMAAGAACYGLLLIGCVTLHHQPLPPKSLLPAGEKVAAGRMRGEASDLTDQPLGVSPRFSPQPDANAFRLMSRNRLAIGRDNARLPSSNSPRRWELKRKLGPTPRSALHVDAASVGFDDLASRRQAQP